MLDRDLLSLYGGLAVAIGLSALLLAVVVPGLG